MRALRVVVLLLAACPGPAPAPAAPPPPSPPPPASSGDPGADLDAALEAARVDVRRCFEAESASSLGQSFAIDVRLSLLPDGLVDDVVVLRARPALHADLELCLRRTLGALRLPPPGEAIDVELPLVFGVD